MLTGVDIYVGGHVHDYERMYDMYRGQSAGRTLNMRATTYITTGKTDAHGSFCGDLTECSSCTDLSLIHI